MSEILAIDPGKRVGWARSDGRCGTIDLGGYDDLGHAYNAFRRWLESEIRGDRPARIVIERAFGVSRFTAELPQVLTGIAHMIAAEYGVHRGEMTASQIKKAVTGNGRANKRAVIAGVALEGWQPDTDHAADACALLMAWQAKRGAHKRRLRAAIPAEAL